MQEHFDAIVIGAGQAGPALAARASAAGWRVALVERHRFGGTCVNTGCIPTKAFVASAHVAHQARRAAEYGVSVPAPVEVDFPAVMARKDRIAGTSSTGVERWVRGLANTTGSSAMRAWRVRPACAWKTANCTASAFSSTWAGGRPSRPWTASTGCRCSPTPRCSR
jgi:phytoene dehydrogenase-like protein